MANGNKPVERVKLKRKDGTEMKGLNRDGGDYSGMNVEFGTVWENDGRKSMTLAPGFTICFQGKEVANSSKESPVYINVFSADKSDAPRKASVDDF